MMKEVSMMKLMKINDEVDVQYPEKLHELHNDLPFLKKSKIFD